MIRVALDSSILVYLAGVSKVSSDDAKIAFLQPLHRKLSLTAQLVVPVQALGEFASVLTRSGFSRSEAASEAEDLAGATQTAPTLSSTMTAALALMKNSRLQLWDSVIISAAAEAGCSILLSEDMQHGFSAHGLTVVNPLVEPVHPKLAALL